MPLRHRMFRALSTPALIALAAVLCVAGAVLVFVDFPGDEPDPRTDAELFGAPDKAVLARPSQLTITDGDDTTTLRRRDDLWRVAEKDGYPARPDRVLALLERLRTPEVLRRVDADADRFAELGVGETEGTWRRRISVRGDEGQALVEIVIGTDRSAPGSDDLVAVHVRVVGSDAVWLVDSDLVAAADPLSWIDTQVIAIPRAELYMIRTAPASGTPLELERPGPAATRLEPRNLPDEDGRLEPGALTEPASVFNALSFEDVRAADDAQPPDTGTGLVRTRDGTRLRFWFETHDNVVWTRFALAQGDPVQPADPETEGERAASGETRTPANVRLRNWAFRLPDYSVQRLRWSVEDIPRAQTPESGASSEAQ